MAGKKMFVMQKFDVAALCIVMSGLTGCDRKEKVIEIETPNGEVEVERSTGTGKVDVDVDTRR